jgi:type IV secretory pathway VirB10-like protein
MPSTQELIVRRKPRRSLNVVALLVMFAGVIGLAALVIFLISKLGGGSATAYADTGAPNGAPSTMKATDVAGPDMSAWRSPAPQVAFTQPPVVQPTAPPAQPPATQRASGGGDDGSAAREAARARAEKMRQEEEARRQRLADAMRSMGGVAIADTSDDGAQGQPDAQAAPSGPVLGIGTRIPVLLTQSLDSTFGGQFSVPVTDDVWDERRTRVLIPRGSTCFGNTGVGGVDGQARIYGAVTLCKLPNFDNIALDKFPLIDADGATGLKARVDDHGAGRRNRGNAFSSIPSMVAGTLIPGVGGMVASSAASAAQSSDAGRAIPGPTLSVDASPQKPRAASILVTRDTVIGGSN